MVRKAKRLSWALSGRGREGGEGQLLDRTEPQGMGRFLFEGLGKRYEAGMGPGYQTYRWPVGRGDWLVFGSDGLFDARIGLTELGVMIAETGNAADATRRLRDEVGGRMKERVGKPDNLTILIIRIGDA